MPSSSVLRVSEDGVLLQSVSLSGVTGIRVYGNDGNDSIDFSGNSIYGYPAMTLNGGSGNDSIVGGIGNDVIQGLGGNDYIEDRAGNDVVDAGVGDDHLIGSNSGSDTLYGGEEASDWDSITFDASNVSISLDNLANDVDGGLGGTNNIRAEFELITGSIFADSIVGSDFDEDIRSRDGSDTLKGLGGDDLLDGGSSSDRLWGGNGNDVLMLDNSGFNDPGTDTAYGEAGNDEFWYAEDGISDTVDGGGGTDIYYGQIESVDTRLSIELFG
jgi:Ca2+-binding RTX toxin-like protein